MSAFDYFFLVAATFGATLVIGLVARSYLYRRYGYPPTPPFLSKARLGNDIETIYQNIEPLISDSFTIVRRDVNALILKRSSDDPASVMTIEFFRSPTSSHNKIVVKCQERPWLSWDSIRSMPSGPKSTSRQT